MAFARKRPTQQGAKPKGDPEVALAEVANKDEKLGLKGDYGNIALLLFLYMLQGVPLGLSQTMDLILQEKNIPYEEQGIFSSVSWPYSLKLLWAPLVDALYFGRFGRRKTWLVPTQLLLGTYAYY
jgi:PAT family acetyl-CoA transporter-like MFS transporter 1